MTTVFKGCVEPTRVLLFAMLLTLSSCAPSTITEPHTPSPDAQAPRDVSQDSGGSEVAEMTPVFEFGVNTTGTNTPEHFSLLNHGDSLGVELGFQGLWMVVLAFRTRDIFTGDLTILTSIQVGDDEQGVLGLARQRLIPGGDGLGYYYNLFLVVREPEVAGSEAVVTLDVTDEQGVQVLETRTVNLVLIEPNR